jgi:hypothetical protein
MKGIRAEGGLRDYFLIFVGITVFLSTFWFFRYKGVDVKRWFYVILAVGLLLGDLKLFGVFKMLSIDTVPFLKGFGAQEIGGGRQYLTFGGLRNLGMLGVPMILTLLYEGRLTVFSFLILCNFIAFSFFAGGRAAFYGVILAIMVYVIVIKRRYLFPLLALVLLVISIYGMFFSGVDLSRYRYGRVFLVQGGLPTQDKPRYYAYLYMWEVFKEHPILGKGINYQDIRIHDDFLKEHPEITDAELRHMETQIGGGGHGSYLSILSNFGIGGMFFFMVILFGSMYYAYRIFKGRGMSFDDDARLALFAFLFLIIQAVRLTVGGTGTDRIEPWFLAGMVAGLIAKDNAGKEGILSSGEWD